VIHPYAYDSSWLVVVLVLAAALMVVGLFAWFVASLTRPSEDTAMRIATERFARGEIEKNQLRFLLRAL
jgi:uncharacterized membrane protein